MSMAIQLVDFDERVRQSALAFWRSRRKAARKQLETGRADQGNRGAVTGGKTLDGFRDMMVEVVRRYGPPGTTVYRDRTQVILPGYFRPTKQWDILVVHEERLLAALELKSLCGPSFGNNANNRCEEALGSACDFRQARSESLFGPGATPFLGYFILVEDAVASRTAVGAMAPHFPNDPVFQGASYQTRMKILCERMMEKQLYTSAAVLVSPDDATGSTTDLSRPTALRTLLSKLAGHLAGEAGALPPRGQIEEDPAPPPPHPSFAAGAAPEGRRGFLEGKLFEPLTGED